MRRYAEDVSEVKRRLVDRVTEPTYIADLAGLSVVEVRSKREECTEAENEVSFERRLCQARVDTRSPALARGSGCGV